MEMVISQKYQLIRADTKTIKGIATVSYCSQSQGLTRHLILKLGIQTQCWFNVGLSAVLQKNLQALLKLNFFSAKMLLFLGFFSWGHLRCWPINWDALGVMAPWGMREYYYAGQLYETLLNCWLNGFLSIPQMWRKAESVENLVSIELTSQL